MVQSIRKLKVQSVIKKRMLQKHLELRKTTQVYSDPKDPKHN